MSNLTHTIAFQIAKNVRPWNALSTGTDNECTMMTVPVVYNCLYMSSSTPLRLRYRFSLCMHRTERRKILAVSLTRQIRDHHRDTAETQPSHTTVHLSDASPIEILKNMAVWPLCPATLASTKRPKQSQKSLAQRQLSWAQRPSPKRLPKGLELSRPEHRHWVP